MNIARLTNRTLSKLISKFPHLAKLFIKTYSPQESMEIPWTPVSIPLNRSRVAIVTTSGVHQRDQTPFDMENKEGDPTFRIIDAERNVSDLIITHDYYDHADAEKDINIVFPVERLRELMERGIIGELARYHFGFMGHIKDSLVPELKGIYIPDVIAALHEEDCNVVLLTPA